MIAEKLLLFLQDGVPESEARFVAQRIEQKTLTGAQLTSAEVELTSIFLDETSGTNAELNFHESEIISKAISRSLEGNANLSKLGSVATKTGFFAPKVGSVATKTGFLATKTGFGATKTGAIAHKTQKTGAIAHKVGHVASKIGRATSHRLNQRAHLRQLSMAILANR